MFLFICAIIVYGFIVWPSIDGGFVLDDWPNLSGLATIDKTRGAWSYIFDGTASSLGRQVSYITFALQADHWPDNPAPFKIVNILIHLLNALLLFSLVFLITKILGKPRSIGAQLSFLVTLIWMILPIHASSVFYVVQRMTLISLTFTLLGLVSFAYSCLLYRQQRHWQSVLLLSVGMGFGYLFGILSKENAVLMGIFALAIYGLIPRDQRNFDRLWKAWFYSCCLLPIIALIIYLLIDQRYLSGYGNRDFDITQRLLTEPIILWDYLKKIVLPSAYSLNLYNDGFPIAGGLWHKPYSGFAIMAWLVVALIAFIFRQQAPYLLFAMLWFIGGHLLESTVVGLELYFEHRNYVPSIGIVIGLVFGLYHFSGFIAQKFGERSIRGFSLFGLAGMCLYIAWLTIVLRVEAETWGDPRKFAMASLSERPASLRAFQDAAAYFANQQDFFTAYSILEEIDSKWNGYSGTMAQQLLIHCLAPEIPPPPSRQVLERFGNSKFDFGITDALNEILNVKKRGGCVTVSWDEFRTWVEALFNNPEMRGEQQNIVVLLAYSYNAEERFKEAAEALQRLEKTREDIGFMLLKARFIAMAGDFDGALAVLAELRAKYSNKPQIWLPNQGMVEELQQTIEKQISINQ